MPELPTVEKVAQALNEIVAKTRQVNDLAAEVASASSEQNDGINQINAAVSQVDQVTQSNAASAEESAAAAASKKPFTIARLTITFT